MHIDATVAILATLHAFNEAVLMARMARKRLAIDVTFLRYDQVSLINVIRLVGWPKSVIYSIAAQQLEGVGASLVIWSMSVA